MNSDEIDRYIATEVMGWTFLQGYYASPVGDGEIIYPSDWSPSTRIDHAWEVVRKIIGRGLDFELCYSGCWTALFFLIDEQGNLCNFSADGQTAPLAICRAALEAVKPQ